LHRTEFIVENVVLATFERLTARRRGMVR